MSVALKNLQSAREVKTKGTGGENGITLLLLYCRNDKITNP